MPPHRDSISGPFNRYTDCAFTAYNISEIPGKCLNVAPERVEKINWRDRVRNEEILHTDKVRNILRTAERMKASIIGHILRRN
jgi:hypothetical protein